MVDPLEAPPPGPRVLGSEGNCKGTKTILYVDPVGGPPQGQPLAWLTLWRPLHRVHVFWVRNQLYSSKNDTLCGPGGDASTGSTPGLVDPLEAPPPGPRVLGSEGNCKGAKTILYVDPFGGPPQGQQPARLTLWRPLHRVHVFWGSEHHSRCPARNPTDNWQPGQNDWPTKTQK